MRNPSIVSPSVRRCSCNEDSQRQESTAQRRTNIVIEKDIKNLDFFKAQKLLPAIPILFVRTIFIRHKKRILYLLRHGYDILVTIGRNVCSLILLRIVQYKEGCFKHFPRRTTSKAKQRNVLPQVLRYTLSAVRLRATVSGKQSDATRRRNMQNFTTVQTHRLLLDFIHLPSFAPRHTLQTDRNP